MGAEGAGHCLLLGDQRSEGGKLKAAARALTRGAAGRDEAVEDARNFEFPAEIIEALEGALQAQGANSAVEVWAENWDIVVAFAAIMTQWRVSALASGRVHYVGLDYSAVRAGFELAGIETTPELWEGVRQMEAEAAASLNSARS